MILDPKSGLDCNRETVRIYEAAERNVSGTCDCPGNDSEHTGECDRAVLVACYAAQHEVLRVLGQARVELERWIARRELELRVEELSGRVESLSELVEGQQQELVRVEEKIDLHE